MKKKLSEQLDRIDLLQQDSLILAQVPSLSLSLFFPPEPQTRTLQTRICPQTLARIRAYMYSPPKGVHVAVKACLCSWYLFFSTDFFFLLVSRRSSCLRPSLLPVLSAFVEEG